MSDAERLGELKELFVSAPIPRSTLVVALGLGSVLAILVIWLVRRRALREEYTPIWLLTAAGIIVAAAWRQPIHWLSYAVGAWTQASTIFFLALVFLAAISLNFAVRVSRLSLQVKNLGQEIALLRSELDRRVRDRADLGGPSPSSGSGSTAVPPRLADPQGAGMRSPSREGSRRSSWSWPPQFPTRWT